MLEMGMSMRLTTKLSLKLSCFPDFISKPLGQCPNCKHKLTGEEIKAGFSNSTIDIRTTCPRCGMRFISNLMIDEHIKKNKFKVEYLCQSQVLHRMMKIKEKRGRIGIKWLSDHKRPLYYNIVKHFGTYENGLEAMKLAY